MKPLPYRLRTLFSAVWFRPALHLVYLLFYFIPWLSRVPNSTDIVWAVILMGLFIPLYFCSITRKGRTSVTLIAAMQFFTVVAAPLHAMNGVFHIYAAAQAGYQKQSIHSAILFLALTTVYITATIPFERNSIEIVFSTGMGAVVWISCLADAGKLRKEEESERERELERQQVSIAERERIARDLHDLLGHTLTMVSVKSDLALKLLDEDPNAARSEVEDMRQSSREALSEIRAVLSGINYTSLKVEIAKASQALKAAGVSLVIEGDLSPFASSQEHVMALVVRETVTNVVRHSSATVVKISFTTSLTHHATIIEDNGIGSENSWGDGLMGLKERVARIGGTTDISLAGGARISVFVPIESSSA